MGMVAKWLACTPHEQLLYCARLNNISTAHHSACLLP